MYGLVNKAIKDLAVSNYGNEKWIEICKLKEFHEEEFLGMNSYRDKLTYDLVKNDDNDCHVFKNNLGLIRC